MSASNEAVVVVFSLLQLKPEDHSHALPPPGKKGRTYICSCMLYLRPTDGAKLLMRAWMKELQERQWSPSQRSNDQPAFNWALNKTAGQVPTHPLSSSSSQKEEFFFSRNNEKQP